MKRLFGYMALAAVLPVLLTTGCKGTSEEDSVKMVARVTALGEKIEVEVLESEYTTGSYRVITGEDTVYEGREGKIQRGDISVGDTVEIYYNGQVMLSYPPQIVAHRILVKT